MSCTCLWCNKILLEKIQKYFLTLKNSWDCSWVKQIKYLLQPLKYTYILLSLFTTLGNDT